MKRRSAQPAAEDLRRLMQRLFRRFGALATNTTPCGKPLSMAHAHALMILRARGELSQRELGAELGIDKSNVTRLCEKLVVAGHATQRLAEADRRSRRIVLTPRGARLAQEVEASSRAKFEALLSAVPRASRSHVLEGLTQLAQALDAAPATQESKRSPR